MTLEEVRAHARHAGIEMSVPPDKDVINVRMPTGTPDEFRSGIRVHRYQLQRDLLLEQANEFIRVRKARNMNPEAWRERAEVVEKMQSEGTLEEYRAALRAYIRAYLEEAKRARESSA